MDDTLYRILSGVHRSVAAREAGLLAIRARVDTVGALSPVILVPLVSLYSGKPEVGRFDRGRDIHDLIGLIADDVSRECLDPIEIAVIRLARTKYYTPLMQVTLNPV